MENQESVKLTSTTDYDDMGDLAYDDDDDDDNDDDGEKYLEDDTVKNKEIQELGQCTKYPNSTRRGSQSSQSSRTSALTNLMGKKVVLNSLVIPEEGRPEDLIDVNPDSNVALMSMLLSGGEQSSSKTTEVAKEIFNQTTNPNNSENVDVSISKDSGGQIQHPKCEKCSEEISIEFTKDTVFLSFLEEANVSDASSNTGKFLYFFDMIDQAEKKMKIYGKDRAKALIEEEVRKQIPETKFSNEALRRRRGRAEKVYKLFNSISKTKIERIRSFPARFILNLSDNNVNRVIAEVLRAEQR
ncbi:unnamed protein product [Rhizophagus irregularis]|nr:unnamed protein product [Rhizophagus irregularis]